MQDIRIAAAQFEHKNGDKEYNLSRIHELTRQAVERGAQVVSFHECCISAYSFVQPFSKEQLLDLAEPVSDGPSVQRLMEISREFSTPLLAGLVERDGNDVYNTYVCVDGDKLVARFRKLHAFVNPLISSGSEYCVFEICGTKCGILICYDNNLIENVRITALKGAEILLAPHQTGGCDSPSPRCMGKIDPKLWENREIQPEAIEAEFRGPKGREWLMHWLPARAHDNGLFLIFSNNH